jgi:hypothetical protein
LNFRGIDPAYWRAKVVLKTAVADSDEVARRKLPRFSRRESFRTSRFAECFDDALHILPTYGHSEIRLAMLGGSKPVEAGNDSSRTSREVREVP